MIVEQISPQQWVSIKQETRTKLATLFKLTKGGTTIVTNGQLISDGFLAQDLAAITLEKLEWYSGLENKTLVENLNRIIEMFESNEPIELKIKKKVELPKVEEIEVLEDSELDDMPAVVEKKVGVKQKRKYNFKKK